MKKFKITVDGKAYNVEVEEVREGVVAPQRPVPTAKPVPAPAALQRQERPQVPTGDGSLTAPMPGTILKVLVSKGDKVETGQALVILEAMKMENKINATTTGTITSIEVSQGQNVDTGQLLLTIG